MATRMPFTQRELREMHDQREKRDGEFRRRVDAAGSQPREADAPWWIKPMAAVSVVIYLVAMVAFAASFFM